MARADRLFDLLQCPRRHRRPVTGQTLADELGVSLRTGCTLPPLMFTADEIEALVLGARWVAARGDTAMARAAEDVLSKVPASLPHERRDDIDDVTLLVGPAPDDATDPVELSLRAAIRMRGDYRHFRTDRITSLVVSDTRYPRRRNALLRGWRALRNLDPDSSVTTDRI